MKKRITRQLIASQRRKGIFKMKCLFLWDFMNKSDSIFLDASEKKQIANQWVTAKQQAFVRRTYEYEAKRFFIDSPTGLNQL